MEEKMICLRDKIGEFLCEFGEKDDRIYVIDSDLAKSTKAIEFQNKFPERFVEAGISEASAMSIAMGLASEGQIPFYVNFAIFVSGTAWTQLRQAAYANSNIKMIAIKIIPKIMMSPRPKRFLGLLFILAICSSFYFII